MLGTREFEEQYRIFKLDHDRTQAMTVMIFVFFILVVFIFLEFHYLKRDFAFYAKAGIRCIVMLITLVAGWRVYRLSRISEFDVIMLSWAIAVVSHMLAVTYVNEGHFTTLYAWDLLVILGIYVSLPVPFSFQLIPALFLTAGGGTVWLFFKMCPLSSLETGATLSSYCVANIFGIFLSIRLKRSDRKQYILLINERNAKAQLERTMTEIKVLRGILPLCSFCKKVRDDKGYWEQVDVYINKYAEIDVSHSVCPECMKKHYPEEYKLIYPESTEDDSGEE